MGRYAKPVSWTKTPRAPSRPYWARTILGALASANGLAVDLYQLGEVRPPGDLTRTPWPAAGPPGPRPSQTLLTSASNLAADLRALGEIRPPGLGRGHLGPVAVGLGPDHPDTLYSANDLANDLNRLGEVQAACDLHQDTLDRRRRVLGR